jgi:hypothetical protein
LRSSRKDTWSQNSTPRGSSMCVSHTHARNQARTHGHPPELMRCGGGTRPHTSPQSTFKGRHAMEVRFRALPEGRKKQIFDLLPGYPARGCGHGVRVGVGGSYKLLPAKRGSKKKANIVFTARAHVVSLLRVCRNKVCILGLGHSATRVQHEYQLQTEKDCAARGRVREQTTSPHRHTAWGSKSSKSRPRRELAKRI